MGGTLSCMISPACTMNLCIISPVFIFQRMTEKSDEPVTK